MYVKRHPNNMLAPHRVIFSSEWYIMFRYSLLQTVQICFLESVYDWWQHVLKISTLQHRAPSGNFRWLFSCRLRLVCAQSVDIGDAWDVQTIWVHGLGNLRDYWRTAQLCGWCLVELCPPVILARFFVVLLNMWCPCGLVQHKLISSPSVM